MAGRGRTVTLACVISLLSFQRLSNAQHNAQCQSNTFVAVDNTILKRPDGDGNFYSLSTSQSRTVSLLYNFAGPCETSHDRLPDGTDVSSTCKLVFDCTGSSSTWNVETATLPSDISSHKYPFQWVTACGTVVLTYLAGAEVQPSDLYNFEGFQACPGGTTATPQTHPATLSTTVPSQLPGLNPLIYTVIAVTLLGVAAAVAMVTCWIRHRRSMQRRREYLFGRNYLEYMGEGDFTTLTSTQLLISNQEAPPTYQQSEEIENRLRTDNDDEPPPLPPRNISRVAPGTTDTVLPQPEPNEDDLPESERTPEERRHFVLDEALQTLLL